MSLFIWRIFGYAPPDCGQLQPYDGIQEQVQTNKDLDLPTQQELLAQFRCDEISTAALAEFGEQAKSQKRPIEAGRVVEGLGTLMRSWRDQALGGLFPLYVRLFLIHGRHSAL